MKQKHLKTEVLNVFKELTGKSFTVGQAIATYMASSSCLHSDQKSTRQFIYRNMLRLIESGELEKITSQSGKQQFRLTEQFRERVDSNPSKPKLVQKKEKILVRSSKQSLSERLSHQKLELLTAMGESEEYDEIYQEIPEMREEIQSLYNDSRNRCSKLLGKVKALENLISISSR